MAENPDNVKVLRNENFKRVVNREKKLEAHNEEETYKCDFEGAFTVTSLSK